MREVEIRLFGAFKKYVPDGRIQVPLRESCTVAEIKKAIQEYLTAQYSTYQEKHLVFESALATDDEIFGEDALVVSQMNLALLPPVCGG